MDHYIYVAVASNGFCKIGCTRTPDLRLQQLRRSLNDAALNMVHVRRVERDAFRVERAIHYRLAAHRIAREWFAVSPERAIAVINQSE